MPEAVHHGGGIAAAADRFGGAPADWLDLSTGINPVPPSLRAVPPELWARLPDRDIEERAREAAQRFYGAAILPLPVPGTQSVIQQLPRLVPEGARAAIVGPTYGEYSAVLRRAGLIVDSVASLGEIGNHRLAVVVNPNNPDGRRHERAGLLALADRLAETGGLLVVDEAFADADAEQSVAGAAGSRANLIVFRSFGKFFGLAGLRLGFVLSAPSIEERLAVALGPWAVSGPALCIAASLMADDAAVAAIRASIAERHAAMAAVLGEAAVPVVGGTSLFFLLRHPKAEALHRHLAERHILVRRFDYEPSWLRVGLSPDPASDRRVAEALAAFAARAGALSQA